MRSDSEYALRASSHELATSSSPCSPPIPSSLAGAHVVADHRRAASNKPLEFAAGDEILHASMGAETYGSSVDAAGP